MELCRPLISYSVDGPDYIRAYRDLRQLIISMGVTRLYQIPESKKAEFIIGIKYLEVKYLIKQPTNHKHNTMPFSVTSKKNGKTYYLHVSKPGPNGKHMYYFSGDSDGGISLLPDGYEVGENSRTGLPFLRKKK